MIPKTIQKAFYSVLSYKLQLIVLINVLVLNTKGIVCVSKFILMVVCNIMLLSFIPTDVKSLMIVDFMLQR
jgi:hypothetical protein